MSGSMIILQGITMDEFREIMKADIRQEIRNNESQKANPLSKTEACDQLGISYKTLVKAMERTGLKAIYPADLEKIRKSCPELFCRAKAR